MTSEQIQEKPSELAKAAVKGASWTYVAFYSGKFVVLLSTIFLARLLTKSDFGVVGYALTVIGFLDTVKDLGINASLIYHKDDRVVNTAFWLNIASGATLFAVIWMLAPFVGVFFNDDRAIDVTRILALNFPLASLGATHEALLIKNLAFSKKFVPEFLKAISKGGVSISLAYMGFGPWSLIVGQLTGTIVAVIALWWIVGWRPEFSFNLGFARSLLNFGLSMVAMNIVSVLAQDVDYLLIGRYLGADALGVYTLAFRIPELVILQFCATVAQVIFPIFTKIREDEETLRIGFLETTRYVALVTTPLGVGMALLAEPFVLALFGEKWIEVAPVLQAIAIYSFFLSLGFNAGDIYKAQGRPILLTYISILQLIILTPLMFWAVTGPSDIVVVGWVQVFVSFVISVVYLVVALRMLKVSFGRLASVLKTPVVPAIAMSLSMLGILHLIGEWSVWFQLVIGMFSGGVVYLSALYLFEREIVLQAIRLFGSVLNRR
jgi:O-antigen/teichoic acid export membrane protein